jgi:hypothetical protein
MKNSEANYGPNKRDFFEQKPRKIKTDSTKDATVLPDPVTDPIVANNIATTEFDYTYNGGEQI